MDTNTNTKRATTTTVFTDVLTAAARTIQHTRASIDPDEVMKSIQVLTQSSGSLIVTGVGKSGIIAHKVAATFASIGIRAVALNPSDALHGDIGWVSAGDVALLISQSGQTAELLELAPHLISRHVQLIVVTGNPNTHLARMCTAVLNTGVTADPGPLPSLPTASSIAAMAVADALAVTILTKRGLTSEAFARNHPAGRIGKRLTLIVADVMKPYDQCPCVLPQSKWLDVLGTMSSFGHGVALVIGPHQNLLGIITDGDLRRSVQKYQKAIWNMQAQDIMTLQPVTAQSQDLAYKTLQHMEAGAQKISSMPVIDTNDKCIGLIRLHDLVACGLV